MIRTVVLAALVAIPAWAQAHVFLVKPDAAEAPAGKPVGLSVLMTEKLFEGERLLAPESVQARLLGADGETPVPLRADVETKALRGQVVTAAVVVLAARAAPRYRAIEKGEQTDDPARTLRIEAFSKALLTLQPGAAGFDRLSHDRLELIPLDNPANDGIGELRVRVLFDGKPLATRVQLMAAGKPRVSAMSDQDGVVRLPVTERGFHLVRTAHHIEEPDARSARYEATASLVFAIN